ncbi:MAG: hypothetical protein WC389_17140 [Lutibacter sp.]
MSLQIENATLESCFYKQPPILERKLRMGNVKGKILVPVDSRTTLFIKKKSKIKAAVKMYSEHMSNPFKEVILKVANHKPK